MTFISSIVTKEGILLASDSFELTQGGMLIWDDFVEILASKGVGEDDTVACISPVDIANKFKETAQKRNSRIKNKGGAVKTFKLSDNSALQVAGNVVINGKEISEIVSEINTAFITSSTSDAEQLKIIAYNILKENIEKDSSDSAEYEFIFSVFNPADVSFNSCKFFLENTFLRDDNNRVIMDGNQPKMGNVFICGSFRNWFNIAGWVNFFREMNNLNTVYSDCPFSLIQAFDISESLMQLVVNMEASLNEIPGIGGVIQYSIITKDGFKYISSKSDILNL
jgi:hypothetical protein